MPDLALHRLLEADGTLIADSPLPVERVADLFHRMVAARTYDRKATVMQKQGRLATYAPFQGQEAAQIGATAALDPQDWVVGTYRDAAAMWDHGYPWVNLILGRTGDERGGCPPEGVNVLPPSITVGAHMIHAVGIGWAAALRGTGAVAMTFFGDGATSEGDFHEAMNFAGVYATPTVFVCQNNGWAISMPRERQTASETIAHKGVAYGVEGVLVDGNDLLAVYDVAQRAVAKAREGGGPTLIEAVTYRIGPHTTTDDDRRYRPDSAVEEWRLLDPLQRVRGYLAANDAWSEEWERAIEEAESEAVEQAVTEAEAMTALGPGDIFDAMYAELTGPLQAQREASTGSGLDRT